MKPFILSLLFLLFFTTTTTSSSSSITQTCQTITQTRPDIGYDFCVSSLQSDPTTANTDTSDRTHLAIVASNLSIANATSIMSKIASMMEMQSDPMLKDCLSTCSEVYDEAIDHLNDAITSLKGMNYEEAQTYLSAALDASENCEDAFDEDGAESPVAVDDWNYGKLADIALTITASLR